MQILFVHQNFPGQYRHVAKVLAADPGHRILAIGEAQNLTRQGILHPAIQRIGYTLEGQRVTTQHPWLKDLEAAVIRGHIVSRIALELRTKGFTPDLIAGHPGWGETLFLRDVYPRARILSYCEFFYRGEGADVGFDPEYPARPDDLPRLRARNMTHLTAIESADVGISPTQWQRSLYPPSMRPKIRVLHEGIDTTQVRPDPDAVIEIGGLRLRPGDPVVTYVARNLEPYRGFHCFMRALPGILTATPRAQVVVIGGDEVSYGKKRGDGQTFRQALTAEIGGRAEWGRVHFLGQVPYATYLRVLQVSAAHVYLTYPFVLSWSLLESMAAGCLVVASDTAPVREVVRDGENGLLTDFFDTGRLAERVTECLANQTALAPLRERARQTVVEGYDLNAHCLPTTLALLTGGGAEVGAEGHGSGLRS
ncbi:glycosyltransferase family 4 protein [uncultured Lamprocystis sp.]|jgi:glycosyltransferase involved in cell wall biosynthesis|uniref:glycosyltransferase family 4 protein n=1 Tax=uncultured Lamprocystis sp. TaxID=543132 RepID=UPI0025FE8E00|nr:glycosyltransferase family 4 protein [uncultured Lamprocystis sp.]